MWSLVPFLPRLRARLLPASTTTSLAAPPPPFPVLVAMHQGAVRAFLRRLCDDDALADDLAQETFLKARRALSGFRGDGRVASWLLRIAMASVFRIASSWSPIAVESAGLTIRRLRMWIRR